MVQDTSKIKEKILFVIKQRGPSLPVHIAQETELSILFASAFLSELVSEKKIKISHMRVGSSPVYFLHGQEQMLEKFSYYLKSKEHDAFALLKEKRFLKDKLQEPAIKVALRKIKDFAISFEKNQEIYWRYFTVREDELEIKKPKIQKTNIAPQKIKEKQELQELNIFDKTQEQKTRIARPTEKKKQAKKKTSAKKNERFFNKVKEFLLEKSIEIIDIESFNKNDLVLKIKDNEKEELLVAYNKRRITEADIIKAHKKASELNLSYIILSLGEPLKKLTGLIKAVKNLSAIEKIE